LGYIAFCDILIMVSYLVLITLFGFGVDPSNPPPGFDLIWIYFLLGHVILSIALHTNTLYICVVMAYIRCKSINGGPCFWNHQRTA
ncbi:Protein DMSR-5, partial [Aphelenchoides avenae]